MIFYFYTCLMATTPDLSPEVIAVLDLKYKLAPINQELHKAEEEVLQTRKYLTNLNDYGEGLYTNGEPDEHLDSLCRASGKVHAAEKKVEKIKEQIAPLQNEIATAVIDLIAHTSRDSYFQPLTLEEAKKELSEANAALIFTSNNLSLSHSDVLAGTEPDLHTALNKRTLLSQQAQGRVERAEKALSMAKIYEGSKSK